MEINNNEFIPYMAIPPGEFILDKMDEMDMTQKELANRTGLTEKHISNVLNGEVEIKRPLAESIGTIVGIGADVLLNLEMLYQRAHKNVAVSEEEKEIATSIPFKMLVERGFLENISNITDRIKSLRIFFNVLSLENIKKLYANSVVCSKAKTKFNKEYDIYTWCRIAELKAEKIESDKEFSIRELKNIMPKLRAMTIEGTEGFEKAVALCRSIGLIIVVENHVPNSGVNAIFLKKKNRYIIQLSVRDKKASSFWFNFFHELHHVIDGRKNVNDIDVENDINRKAANFLIPNEQYINFVKYVNFRKLDEINKFAKEINILPMLILSRLQFEGHITYNTKAYKSICENYIIK